MTKNRKKKTYQYYTIFANNLSLFKHFIVYWYHPDSLKLVQSTPLFKKGDRKNISNYLYFTFHMNKENWKALFLL